MQLFLATNMHSRYSDGRISSCLCAFVANPILAKAKRFISHEDTKALRIK